MLKTRMLGKDKKFNYEFYSGFIDIPREYSFKVTGINHAGRFWTVAENGELDKDRMISYVNPLALVQFNRYLVVSNSSKAIAVTSTISLADYSFRNSLHEFERIGDYASRRINRADAKADRKTQLSFCRKAVGHATLELRRSGDATYAENIQRYISKLRGRINDLSW
ncbi:MAG TPA: hypothetical protein VMV00_00495 [Candidatus Baltobacteraceae bacterium]|nr:hypothetical protein [Candidatus Baltobacteraceae bacterium]